MIMGVPYFTEKILLAPIPPAPHPPTPTEKRRKKKKKRVHKETHFVNLLTQNI